MSRRRVMTFALSAIAASVVGRSLASQARQPSRPPRMELRAHGGGAQRATLSTYCWGSRCVDMGGFHYPERPLVVEEHEALLLDFAELGALRRLAYTAWPYEDNIQPGPPNWSAKTGPPVVDDVLVFPVSPAPMPGSLPPGLYVIDVFAKARRGGDTYQGFKILVEPVISAATPVTAPPATPLAESGYDQSGG